MKSSCVLPISFFIMYCFSYWQYSVIRNKRLIFEKIGIVVQAETKLVKKILFEDWCQIDFVTKEGAHITDVRKCGGKEGFEKEYKNLYVIYLEGNATEFQELFVYENYSHLYTLFFFFGLLGFGGTFILYYFLKNVRKGIRV